MCPDDKRKMNDELCHDSVIRENVEQNLKQDVNMFLFDKVPQTMTIGEFDKLANKIHNLIFEVWE